MKNNYIEGLSDDEINELYGNTVESGIEEKIVWASTYCYCYAYCCYGYGCNGATCYNNKNDSGGSYGWGTGHWCCSKNLQGTWGIYGQRENYCSEYINYCSC